jgi:hypothetical protein
MMIIIVLLPVPAFVLMLMSDTRIPERHHTHHDTYSVSPVVSRTMLLTMMFTGVLGAVVGWLSHLGVFKGDDPTVPLSFFAAFQSTMMLMLVAVLRYRVMVFEDRIIERPAIGRMRQVAYDDIVHMGWVESFLGPHLRDMRVVAADGTVVRLWCMLDIEQILLRIDRSDSLEK